MPAYNAEAYIASAVDSVLSQSVADWELLIVDDGSTDSTSGICRRYAAENSNIHIITRPNGGMSEARNSGLAQVRGQYISFIDADDQLHPRFLEIMLKAAEESGASIVSAGADWFDSDKGYHPARLPRNIRWRLEQSERCVEDALYQRRLDNAVWGKLYAATLWERLRFEPGIGYEDLDLFYRLWLEVDEIATVSAPLYGYRQHPASYMHTFSTRRADSLLVADRLMERISSKSERLGKAAATRRFAAYYNILMLFGRNRANCPEILRRCREVIGKERKMVLTNPRARVRDRLGALLSYLGADAWMEKKGKKGNYVE